MSFLDELKKDLEKQELETTVPVSANEEKIQLYVKEELSYIRQEVRKAAKSGKYSTSKGKTVFKGSRLWHEGEHKHGTESLATFFPFLSQESMLNRDVLGQNKVLVFGYHYEIRYSLSEKGTQIYKLFIEAMRKEGVIVSDLVVKLEKGNETGLPYTARGTVKYDFELDHHLSDYPKLYYNYRIEL